MNRHQRRAADKSKTGLDEINAAYARAQALFHARNFTAAEPLLRDLARKRPDDHTILSFWGRTLIGVGRAGEAVAPLRRALALAPQAAPYHRNLGLALAAAGESAEARDCFVQALALNALFADAHYQLVALKKNNPALALDLAALNARYATPELAREYIKSADEFEKAGRPAEAAVALEQAHALLPDDGDIALRLGRALYAAEHYGPALETYARLIAREPDNKEYKNLVLHSLFRIEFKNFKPENKALLCALLDTPGLDHQIMARAWTSLALLDPACIALKPLLQAPDFESFRKNFSAERAASLFSDSFFTDGIANMLLPSPALEAFLTHLRRLWLEDDIVLPLPLMVALARQNFLNEYVYACTPEEEEAVTKRAQGKTLDEKTLCLIACYRPLHRAFPGGDKRLKGFTGPVTDLIRAQIDDIRAEEALKKKIPALKTLKDDISLKVQAQYEDNPYPRWQSLESIAAAGNDRLKNIDARNKIYDVLIAGCGTGRHAAMAAGWYQKSNVLGVDLSRSSLAYATRKTQELGMKNLSFLQADILDLRDLGRSFDIIESVGVLHHMKDPEAGWRVLTDILKPGGTMLIGLYSERARQEIVEARAMIAQWGLSDDLAAIREGRQRIFALPADHPLKKLLGSNDFYSASACRDLIFHVQEQRFTLPRIKKDLADLGLEFVHMSSPSPALFHSFRAMFAGPDGACAWTNLDLWDQLEQKYPYSFAGMYMFWCKKGTS